MLQPYLIFQSLNILMNFQIIYFISWPFILQFFIMAVSLWLSATVVITCYCTPSHPNFGCYFLVFIKCGVTAHRLYRDSLTLMFHFDFFLSSVLLFWKCACLFFKIEIERNLPSLLCWRFQRRKLVDMMLIFLRWRIFLITYTFR